MHEIFATEHSISINQSMLYTPHAYGHHLVFTHILKIENRNGECVKETTTQPKNKKQAKATNGSSTQQEKSSTLRS